jgi:hypothetical protein
MIWSLQRDWLMRLIKVRKLPTWYMVCTSHLHRTFANLKTIICIEAELRTRERKISHDDKFLFVFIWHFFLVNCLLLLLLANSSQDLFIVANVSAFFWAVLNAIWFWFDCLQLLRPRLWILFLGDVKFWLIGLGLLNNLIIFNIFSMGTQFVKRNMLTSVSD